jgi:regulatory protein
MACVLAVERKRRDVYEIRLSGDHVFLCPDDVLFRRHVRVDMQLTQPELETLMAEAETVLAVREALAIVARASRSEQEIVTRLQRKEFGPNAIGAAMARLRELGYVDDLALAQRFAHELHQRGDLGRQRQKQRLLRRGFSAEVIDAALGPLQEDDEREKALALARKRPTPVTEKEKRRLAGYLHRRGFGENIVWWCLRQLAAEVDIDKP